MSQLVRWGKECYICEFMNHFFPDDVTIAKKYFTDNSWTVVIGFEKQEQ